MATWYINADTGDDGTGDGSSGNPWLLLSKAHTEATTGDTVVCQDSTATFLFTDQIFTKNLTINGEQTDASGAVFTSIASDKEWTLNSEISLTISNLTFDSVEVQTEKSMFFFATGGASGISFTATRCIWKDTILGEAPTKKTSLFGTGNYGALAGDGAYTIVNCLINGISSEVGGPGNGQQYLVTGGDDATDYIFTGCTIFLDGGHAEAITGLFLDIGVNTSVTIKNTIIRDKDASIPWGDTNFTTVSYSCFNGVTGAPAGTGVITSDPLLVDPDNDNFNLRPTSPCIDTGVVI